LGLAKLNSFDSSAIEEFDVYIKNFEGRNYVKSCLQKMSWYYVLQGNLSKARELQMLIKTKSKSVNEEDRLADQYALKPLPNSDLLKMRLLYDGGDFTGAANAAKAINPKTLANSNLKAEFCYRQGRIYEKMGNNKVALKYYEACSLFAKNSTEYYGAYACIYLGDYYLELKEMDNAERFYQQALKFEKNKEYIESIEQRAKAGLKKI
jgi:tetratricopeptide (TPR) repeat protein